MFYHQECDGQVMLDVSSSFNILGTFGLGKNVTVGILSIMQKAPRFGEPKFYCTTCGKSVNKGELYIRCYHCGSIVQVLSAYYNIGSGGIYCREHAIRLFGESNITQVSVALMRLTQS